MLSGEYLEDVGRLLGVCGGYLEGVEEAVTRM